MVEESQRGEEERDHEVQRKNVVFSVVACKIEWMFVYLRKICFNTQRVRMSVFYLLQERLHTNRWVRN